MNGLKVLIIKNMANKSGVAADTSGHQLAQQFLMCTSLTSLKEDSMYFFTTPVAHKMNKIRVFKLFELQGFQKLPPLSKEVKRAAHKMSYFAFLDLQTSFHQVSGLQNEQSLLFQAF